jgi:fatty-acyl-CoA synthase
VVLNEGKELDADAVIAHCATKFAKWQLPDEVIAMDALPLGPTGKVDKKTIRANMEQDGYKLPDQR